MSTTLSHTKGPSKRQLKDMEQAQRRFARYEEMDRRMRERRRHLYSGSIFWADFSLADVLQWVLNTIQPRH